MAKYCLKKPSKRLTCRKKFKIQRKVKEHSRKLQKLAKTAEKRKRGEKPISVPSKCPFKEELLMEAEKKREELKEHQAAQKAKQKAAKTNKKRKSGVLGDKSIEALAKRATTEEDNYTENQFLIEMLPDSIDTANSKSIRSFASEVRRTIENADIVIEVLDARDPLGSRSTQIEKLVVDNGKRLVLLLNKIDLVPRENLLKWLAHLRQELPTIAFKASTQEQNQKLGRYHYSNLNNTFSSKCIGAELVMKLLGNYCRNKDIKTSIRVGVVGFPNVGKSSVINSLKRKKSCQTGATPGLTRQVQEVELDKHIRLLDSPGVVLAPKGEMDPSELSLRNVLRVETLVDPITPVQAILRRCSIKVLMLHYNIPEFSDCDQFLALLSRRFGRLKKGGRPNLEAAAKQVLNDWNSGKLRYYTEPPEKATDANEETTRLFPAELVADFSKEFDLDALDQDIRVIVEEIPQDTMAVDTPYDPNAPLPDKEGDENDEEEKMDTDQKAVDGRIIVEAGKGHKKGGTTTDRDQTTNSESSLLLPESLSMGDGNVQLNRAIRKAVKRRKKHNVKIANRAEKLADKLGEQMEL